MRSTAHPEPFATDEAISRAEALYRERDYVGAGALLTPLADRKPPDPTAIRMLGLCRLRLGHHDAALALLQRAHDLAPTAWTALHLGLGLHAVGRHAEAAALFKSCQPLLPDDPAPSLNLAAALLALDDNRGAVKAARKAALRAPNLPQAQYMLGLARLAAGELAAAEAAFRETLRLDPRFTDAWVNFGLVRYRLSDMESAKTAMLRALDIVPDHRAAKTNLAIFKRLSGEPQEGEDLLREMIAQDRAAPEPRINLAANLISDQRWDEALSLLEGIPAPSDPTQYRQWQTQRATALIYAGRHAEARTALVQIGEDAPGLAPVLLWRRLLLSVAEGDAAMARDIAGQMEAALRDPGALLPEHHVMAYFNLARFWAQLREPDRAFPCWVEGHRVLHRFQPFSREHHQDFVDRTIAAFSRSRLSDGARASNRDEAPVFIVGMPRSGTTLAEQIIGAHRDAFGAGERAELGNAFHALCGGWSMDVVEERVAALGRDELDRIAADYLAALHALAPDAKRVVDKMPANYFHLGLVGLLFPGARIIHCVRDPRDIGLSIFTIRFYGFHPYAHDLGDLGWFIGRHHHLMAHWREAMPNPILTLPLKDWVDDFTGTLRRILDFLDLPYDTACERYFEQDRRVWTASAAQVRQPINAQGIGRWRAYARHLEPLLTELAAAGVALDD